MTADPDLPDFPRPDLPISHPENFPTLRLRQFRRLGLPDDGGLPVSDAISPDVLLSYRAEITSGTPEQITIEFTSLADAVAWAGLITETGTDRSLVTLSGQPHSPYGPATILVRAGWPATG